MKLILTLFSLLVLTGCVTVPKLTKSDIYRDVFKESFEKNGNYQDLAHHWDENARKYYNSYNLSIWEEKDEAEITIGNGPYYGLIKLKQMDKYTTQVDFYAWGGLAPQVYRWVDVIKNAPEK